MPFQPSPSLCLQCPFGVCFEDRRTNPVPGRATKFRILRQNAMSCTFGEFAPGFGKSPLLTYREYTDQLRQNVLTAGKIRVGEPFVIERAAQAMVAGQAFEIIEAAVFWNAAAAWNHLMRTSRWSAQNLEQPSGIDITPEHQVAVVKLPAKSDATALLTLAARRRIDDLETQLMQQGMKLGLSAPDVVAVRLPSVQDARYDVFSMPLADLGPASANLLETAHTQLTGRLSGHELLFALAVKLSMRSDRLYQPLFEANVLKFLMHRILNEHHFKFFVHAGTTEGADARGQYRAASLVSLIAGPPELAVDGLHICTTPVASAQAMLNYLADCFSQSP